MVWAVRLRSHGMPNQNTSVHVTCAVRFFGRKFQYIEEVPSNGMSSHFSISPLWLGTYGLGDILEYFWLSYMTAVYVIPHSPQHTGLHNPHKRNVPFLCRCTVVRRSSGLYGGRGGRDYPAVRTNDGKFSGVGSMQNISTHCYSGTPESGNIVTNNNSN
jgi:hypothetical protein